jgi:threonine/homoserine/homoserine lactone efflux protein
MIGDVGGFFAIATVVIVTPGPDTALTVRNSLVAGRRGGVCTAAGVCAGQATWALATAAGLAALLAASQPLFTAVKVLGAGYLICIGVRALFASAKPDIPEAGAPPTRARRAAIVAFRQGLLSNLGNPKMPAFFVGMLPAFTGGSRSSFWSMLALGLVLSAMTFAWLFAYTVVANRVGDRLRRGRMRRLLQGVTGLSLICLGARAATD